MGKIWYLPTPATTAVHAPLCRHSYPGSSGCTYVRHTPRRQESKASRYLCFYYSRSLGDASHESPGAVDLREAGAGSRAEPTCTSAVGPSWLLHPGAQASPFPSPAPTRPPWARVLSICSRTYSSPGPPL